MPLLSSTLRALFDAVELGDIVQVDAFLRRAADNGDANIDDGLWDVMDATNANGETLLQVACRLYGDHELVHYALVERLLRSQPLFRLELLHILLLNVQSNLMCGAAAAASQQQPTAATIRNVGHALVLAVLGDCQPVVRSILLGGGATANPTTITNGGASVVVDNHHEKPQQHLNDNDNKNDDSCGGTGGTSDVLYNGVLAARDLQMGLYWALRLRHLPVLRLAVDILGPSVLAEPFSCWYGMTAWHILGSTRQQFLRINNNNNNNNNNTNNNNNNNNPTTQQQQQQQHLDLEIFEFLYNRVGSPLNVAVPVVAYPSNRSETINNNNNNNKKGMNHETAAASSNPHDCQGGSGGSVANAAVGGSSTHGMPVRALHLAIQQGETVLVDWMLQQQDEQQYATARSVPTRKEPLTPLQVAAASGHFAIVQQLLSVPTFLSGSFATTRQAVLGTEQEKQQGFGSLLLMDAKAETSPQQSKKGGFSASFYARYYPPILWAAQQGHQDIVYLLLVSGQYKMGS